MGRKGGKGTITTIVLSLTIVVILFGVIKLTETDFFDTKGRFILRDAKEVTPSEFEKECKYVGYMSIINNAEAYKDYNIYYFGTIEDISYGTFGGCTVLLKVKIPNNEIELKLTDKDYGYVYVKLTDKKHNNANKGDYVKAYGTFNKVDKNNGSWVIYMNGLRVIEK